MIIELLLVVFFLGGVIWPLVVIALSSFMISYYTPSIISVLFFLLEDCPHFVPPLDNYSASLPLKDSSCFLLSLPLCRMLHLDIVVFTFYLEVLIPPFWYVEIYYA